MEVIVLEDARVTSTSERVCDPPLLIQSSKRSMRSPWWGCGFWFDPHSLFSNLLFQTAISLSFSLSLSSSNLHPANLPLPFRLLDCNLAAGDGLLKRCKLQPFSFIGFELWFQNIDRALVSQNLIHWLLHVSFLCAQPYYSWLSPLYHSWSVQVKRCPSILWSAAFLAHSVFLARTSINQSDEFFIEELVRHLLVNWTTLVATF